MSEIKHTPGPWTRHEKGAHPHPFICGPVVPVEWGEDSFVLAYIVGMDAEENAKLLELAPTMYAALKKIAAYDDAAASAYLRATGSYASFDEPGSVEIARTALEGET